jgi:chromosome segregation ATPase
VSGGAPDRDHRQLLDNLAAAREELELQAASAREARRVISANEARFLAALDALTEERDALLARLEASEARSAATEERLAGAAGQLAEVEQRLAAQLAQTEALQAELAALFATRTMRWSRVPRQVYRTHVRGEGRTHGLDG